MNGSDLLSDIRFRYPEEKPVVFNYVQARGELLSLAVRVLELETLLSGQVKDKEETA